jgi:hypothetical protein
MINDRRLDLSFRPRPAHGMAMLIPVVVVLVMGEHRVESMQAMRMWL